MADEAGEEPQGWRPPVACNLKWTNAKDKEAGPTTNHCFQLAPGDAGSVAHTRYKCYTTYYVQ